MTANETRRIIAKIRNAVEDEIRYRLKPALLSSEHDERIKAGAEVDIQAVVTPTEFLSFDPVRH